MPDENSGNTAVAESSPAAEAPVTVEVPRDAAAYTNWRMTGELPASKPEAEAKPKAPAKKESSEAPREGAENHAPASEAGSTQEKKTRSNADTRLNEILADLRRSGLTPAELKTFRREAQAAQTEQAKPEPTVKPPETKADPAAPKKPDAKDFKTWEEFEAAKDEYHEKLVDYRSQKAIADYQASQQQQALQRELQAKFAEAKTRYGDEAETTIVSAARAIAADTGISAAVKSMIDGSPVATDLLYVMGSKPPEFEEFLALARTNPAAAIRKVVLTESLVAEELAKAPKTAAATSGNQAGDRDESGKFTPAKKVTSAPPPPREAAGRSAPPADEAERAALTGDFRTFRDAENRKDLAAKRGR
jgi:hypothetical protein